MKKADVIISLGAGELIALYAMYLFREVFVSGGWTALFFYTFPVLIPLVSILGLWITSVIGQKILVIYQLAKFALIGAIFAVIDLTILNFLIEFFNAKSGVRYLLFVTVSFVLATAAKYVFDKFWAFEQNKKGGLRSEFIGFFAVTIISGVIQVSFAYIIVDIFGSSLNLESSLLANIGKLGGIVVASVWNFLGYKFFVFKK